MPVIMVTGIGGARYFHIVTKRFGKKRRTVRRTSCNQRCRSAGVLVTTTPNVRRL